MGRRAGQQDSPFTGALERDGHVAAGEVPQSTVDKLRTPPRGAEGEIIPVDGGHREAPAGRVEGGARTGHPQPDNENVDGLALREGAEIGGPASRVEGSCMVDGDARESSQW